MRVAWVAISAPGSRHSGNAFLVVAYLTTRKIAKSLIRENDTFLQAREAKVCVHFQPVGYV